MGVGSFVFAMPHFISPKLSYSKNINTEEEEVRPLEQHLCMNSNRTAQELETGEVHTTLASYRYFFIVGQILHGIGAAPILTLGAAVGLLLLKQMDYS